MTNFHPYVMPGKPECIRKGSFRSTNSDAFANLLIAFTSKLKVLTLKIQGRKFERVFDSGTEVSVIALQL